MNPENFGMTHADAKRTADEAVATLLSMDGALAAAVVDSESGMVVASGGSGVDIELAAAGYTDVMRAQLAIIRELGITGPVEDYLLTLENEYHVIRPLAGAEDIFLLFVLGRKGANLAMARIRLRQLDKTGGGVRV